MSFYNELRVIVEHTIFQALHAELYIDYSTCHNNSVKYYFLQFTQEEINARVIKKRIG